MSCECCITPPFGAFLGQELAVEYREQAVDKQKCGYPTLIPTNPPRFYLNWSRVCHIADWPPQWAGSLNNSITITPTGCEESQTGSGYDDRCPGSPIATSNFTATSTYLETASGNSFSSNLSGEYTTEMLLEQVEEEFGRFPEWDEGTPWDDGQLAGYAPFSEPLMVAYYTLDGLETTAAAARSRIRIKHPIPPSCYLKIWMSRGTIEVIDGSDVGAVEWEAMDPYVWVGSGNPCVDINASLFDDENRIVADVGDFQAQLNTRVFWRVDRFSLLPDYEPDISDPDNPQPNGYPDPLWEPAAP